MKRSEMLRTIASIIRCTEYIDVPNESYYYPEALAEEILKNIEENGMLPPLDPDFSKKEMTLNVLSGVSDNIDDYFCWEKE